MYRILSDHRCPLLVFWPPKAAAADTSISGGPTTNFSTLVVITIAGRLESVAFEDTCYRPPESIMFFVSYVGRLINL
jgi:hypothetical protein